MNKMNNKGFSLVELIVVIAIMAVLMGVLAPTLIGNIEKSRESTDLQNLDTIRGAVVTVMAEEPVNTEITGKIGTNASIAIEMGDPASAAASQISATDYPKLQAALQKTLAGELNMKSSAALNATNAKVYIVITKDGVVSACVATSEANAKAGTAVACTKTEAKSSGGTAVMRTLISK